MDTNNNQQNNMPAFMRIRNESKSSRPTIIVGNTFFDMQNFSTVIENESDNLIFVNNELR